jgi:putative transcription factor
MICEICGRKTNKLKKVMIDGAVLNVCEACSRFGSAVSESQKRKVEKTIKAALDIQDEEVIEDFGRVLREQREKLGLTQEDMAKRLGLKQSLYKKLEEGDLKPTLDLAKRIEKLLKIKLTKKVVLFEEGEFEKSGLTVADVIKFED